MAVLSILNQGSSLESDCKGPGKQTQVLADMWMEFGEKIIVLFQKILKSISIRKRMVTLQAVI